MKTIRRLMFKIIPDCVEATSRLWLRKSQILVGWPQRLGLKAHLAVCPRCREYQQRLDWITETLAQAPKAPSFDGRYKMSPEQRQRIERFLQDNSSS